MAGMMVRCHRSQLFFSHLTTPCRTQRPQIILLKEGTDTSQGKAQIVSNINACQFIVDAVKTTLGSH